MFFSFPKQSPQEIYRYDLFLQGLQRGLAVVSYLYNKRKKTVDSSIQGYRAKVQSKAGKKAEATLVNLLIQTAQISVNIQIEFRSECKNGGLNFN